jgi:hypothetical protein
VRQLERATRGERIMVAARFDPPNGYPCDVVVTLDDPTADEQRQRAEFPRAQLETWGEGQDWSDEDYQNRMLDSMAQDRVRSSDPIPPPVDVS